MILVQGVTFTSSPLKLFFNTRSYANWLVISRHWQNQGCSTKTLLPFWFIHKVCHPFPQRTLLRRHAPTVIDTCSSFKLITHMFRIFLILMEIKIVLLVWNFWPFYQYFIFGLKVLTILSKEFILSVGGLASVMGMRTARVVGCFLYVSDVIKASSEVLSPVLVLKRVQVLLQNLTWYSHLSWYHQSLPDHIEPSPHKLSRLLQTVFTPVFLAWTRASRSLVIGVCCLETVTPKWSSVGGLKKS